MSDLKDRDRFHLGKVVRNRGKNTGLNALRTMNLAALDNTSLADCIFFSISSNNFLHSLGTKLFWVLGIQWWARKYTPGFSPSPESESNRQTITFFLLKVKQNFHRWKEKRNYSQMWYYTRKRGHGRNAQWGCPGRSRRRAARTIAQRKIFCHPSPSSRCSTPQAFLLVLDHSGFPLLNYSYSSSSGNWLLAAISLNVYSSEWIF